MTTKLQALRDLLEKATPGPWVRDIDRVPNWNRIASVPLNAVGYTVDEPGSTVCQWLLERDAALIAALRNSTE